ncbi:hypothetical protein D3C71_1569610 [compost metagenome]
MLVAGVQHHALGVRIVRAPVVHRLQQLLTVVAPLKLRMNPQQRQHMHLVGRQATGQGRLVVHVAPGAAQAGAEHHAQAPGPAVGHPQPAQGRHDQGHGDQAVIEQQADGWQLQVEVLAYPFAHHDPQATLIAGALGLEQVGERGFVPIGVVQQRARFTAIAVVEQTDPGLSGRSVGHCGQSSWNGHTVPWRCRSALGSHLHQHVSSARAKPPCW